MRKHPLVKQNKGLVLEYWTECRLILHDTVELKKLNGLIIAVALVKQIG